MVDRPFSDKRPFGPFVDLGLGEARQSDEKDIMGTSGIPRPNRAKSNLNVVYVFDKHMTFLPREAQAQPLQDKIDDKVDGSVRIREQRSGQLRRFGIEEQALVVKFGGATSVVGASNSLPVQDGTIHKVEKTIERHFNTKYDDNLSIKAIAYDTE